jgi:hypothetical protein
MLLDFTVPPQTPPVDAGVLKKRVHGLLGKALRGLPQDTRLAVESGASAVVCFVGDPQDALHAALVLRDQVSQRYAGRLAVRVALEMGTVQVEVDAQEQLRVTGDGVRSAARVRDRAQPNELLVSHSYHQLLSHLDPAIAGRFVDQRPGEPQPVKLYAAPVAPVSAVPEPAPPRLVTQPAPLLDGGVLDPGVVREIEEELRGSIGPMAATLVRKIGRRAASAQELRDALAVAIANPEARKLFQTAPLLPPGPRPGERRSAPAHDSRSGATRQVDIAPPELAIIEGTLGRFIGPLAQPLVRREIELCVGFADLVAALAEGIAHPQQRQLFLQALRRALPARRVPD